MYTCSIDKILADNVKYNILNFLKIDGNTSKEFHAKITNGNISIIKTFKQLAYPNLRENCIYTSQLDRSVLNLSLTDKIRFEKIILDPAKTIIFNIVQLKNDVPMTFNDNLDSIKTYINNTAVMTNVPIYANINNMHCKLIPISIIDSNNTEINHAQISPTTEFVIYSEKNKSIQMNLSSISFESINVGGLSNQFKQLVENIFLTRIIPKKVYDKLGIKHIKGAILYGPPGCGKTRIARELGRIIGCKNITVINGPEILSKWVGESEKNLRAIFEKAKTKPDEMNLLIFDEFDSIATVRGKSATNHDDRLVGQLLTMLDGMDDQTDNMIVFAMTNRLDQLDPAVLRPGRFGINLYVGLPDAQGRVEILKIHSKSLIDNNMLESVDFEKLSELTDSFTGAELESVVQKTVQYTLGKQIDFENIMQSVKDIDTIKIKHTDFIHVINNITPQFKSSTDKMKSYTEKIRIDFNSDHVAIIESICNKISASTYPQVIALKGKPRSGKTSVLCKIIKDLGMRVHFINPTELIDLDTNRRSNYLSDAFRSTDSDIIVIDNIENIIEYVMFNQFNAKLLWLLRTLLTDTNKHVIMTTSYYDDLENVTLMHSVTDTYEV